jgi:hypothetical protein
MTQKQYHARLKKFTRLYRKMRTLTKEMKEAGFAYPIGVSITSFENSKIHLSADQGEVLPEFDFSQIEEYQSGGKWTELSARVDGVKFFYLVGSGESDHVGDQT